MSQAINIDFRAYQPATVETFAAAWRCKTWHHLCKALEYRRLAQVGDSYPSVVASMRDEAFKQLGLADAGVTVLYDTNHPDAFHASCRLQLVRTILNQTFCA